MGADRYLRLVATILAMLVVVVSPARAERVISQTTTDLIEITSSYDGERLTFFGNIEPGEGQDSIEGPYDVVIVVTGPALDRVARQKTRQFGVWLNTQQVIFRDFPSFFQVLATRPLLEVSNPATLAVENILPEAQPEISDHAGWWDSSVFGRELVRLMSEAGFFGLNEDGVTFLSETFYTGQLTLPSDAPPGHYLTSTYVFRDGEIVARRAEGFSVSKVGFERFLATSATEQPLLYGIVCVVLALFTGWLGGVIFRR